MRDPNENGDSNSVHGHEEPDDDVRRLMMIAGKRWELPAEARARVYAASLATFDAIPEPAPPVESPMNTGGTGRVWRYAVAASCLMALGATALFFQQDPDSTSTPEKSIASVVYSAGDTTVDNHRPLPGDELTVDAEVATGADGRLQVRLSAGVEMRVDGDTRLQLTNNAQVQLLSGRIYFDTAGGGSVRVSTTMGHITDIGTQFVVELNQTELDVIVREGAVQVERGSNTDVARAQPGTGEKLHFTEQGLLSRAPMPTTDPYWHWIGAASGEYQLDSGSLDDYLRKSAHECGLQLSYMDASSQQAAQTISSHGTTTLSGCLVAIDEVLKTTNRLKRVSPDEGYQLVIDINKDD